MRKLLPFLVVLLVLASSFTLPAQAQDNPITLTVSAGFAGYFRDAEWMPVQVRVANTGDAVSGRLVVRPETSGTGITNSFSTAVTLPSGAQQTAFLYITARSFATQIRVELIDDEGTVIAQREAGISSVQAQDRLSIVITDSPLGAVDLTGARASNQNGYQANFTISDLPTQALNAVDVIMLSDVDSGGLSSAQQQALTDWVTMGGHLIVTGGQNWQATAAGVSSLLPLTPSASRDIDSLRPLATWLRDSAPLDTQTIIATGTLSSDAQVLVAAEDGTPLLARRTLGAGEVDYLAADPNNAPLRVWSSLPMLWLALATTGEPQPGWGNGFIDWESAARAAEILPGYDPLPDILPLFGFLLLYILLIGPLNYVVLNRINRREWAWFTIPGFILLFSVLAYGLGFNLRGNIAMLNRVAVVQVWYDSDRAQVDELVGLLSPRRSEYTLATAGGELLRPIPRPLAATGLLTRNAQSGIDIQEGEQFTALNFNVDASFIAGFHLSGVIAKPDISGEATIAEDSTIAGQQIVRGSVRNDSDLTLTNPVILVRGVALHLEQALAPGDIATFELTLPGGNPPAPALRMPLSIISFFSSRSSDAAAKSSVIDIMSPDRYATNIARAPFGDSLELQTNRREQYFLSSFVNDFYNSGGRGDHVYLVGWADTAPLTTDVSGATWETEDAAVYLIELDSQRTTPSGSVTIASDQFTWLVQNYVGVNEITPVNFQLQPGEEVVFRYTPLPASVLSSVETLTINVADLTTGGRFIPITVWNWETEAWDAINVTNETTTLSDPAPYLGANNAVQVRLTADDIGGFTRIGRVTVEQTGMF